MHKKILLSFGMGIFLFGALGLAVSNLYAGGCYEDPIYDRDLHGKYTQGAFVRDNPCMDGTSVLDTVAGNTVIKVIGETDGWYKVELPDGTIGWTGATLIQITQESLSDLYNGIPESGEQPELFMPPAECLVLEPGDLFKVPDNNAVYLINKRGERLYFSNSEVFHTWYENFSAVRTIANRCVDNYPSPSSPPFGVNYRPGAFLIKVKISPSVYVIGAGNERMKIMSEEVARELYGENWTSLVRDVADVYWPNYLRTNVELSEAVPHTGMLIQPEGSEDVYYVGHDGYVKVMRERLRILHKRFIRTIRSTIFERLQERSVFEGDAGTDTEETLDDASQEA